MLICTNTRTAVPPQLGFYYSRYSTSTLEKWVVLFPTQGVRSHMFLLAIRSLWPPLLVASLLSRPSVKHLMCIVCHRPQCRVSLVAICVARLNTTYIPYRWGLPIRVPFPLVFMGMKTFYENDIDFIHGVKLSHILIIKLNSVVYAHTSLHF